MSTITENLPAKQPVADDGQLELIVKLLAQGYNTREVALMWELDPEDVAAIEKQHENYILDQRALASLTRRTIDAEIDETEALAVQKLRGQLPLLSDPMQILKIFSAMNAAKRKTAPSEAGTSFTPNALVQMPASLIQQVTQVTQVTNNNYVVDSHKRITEVAGRPMVSAGNAKVQELLASRRDSGTGAQLAMNALMKRGLANEAAELTLDDLSFGSEGA